MQISKQNSIVKLLQHIKTDVETEYVDKPNYQTEKSL